MSRRNSVTTTRALDRRAFTTLCALDRGIAAFERAVVGAGVLGIALASIVNVAARNLMGGSLPFIEELNEALMIWVTFAGLGLGARHTRHIRMSAFSDQLRGRPKRALASATAIGTCLVLGVLSAYAFAHVSTSMEVGRVTPAIRVPIWIIQTIVPLGLALGALEYGLLAVRSAGGADVRPGEHDEARDPS